MQIAVEDHGAGVPAEDRESIFDRFNRGSRAGRRLDSDGVGLGLALVAEHVNLHGGRCGSRTAPTANRGALRGRAADGGAMSRHVRRSWARRRWRPRRWRAAGCGIPTDDGPRAISRENVPADVVDATTEATASQPTVTAPIYLVESPEDPRLVTVDRRVPAGSPAAGPDPAAVLETLLRATANPQEQAGGITNLIPAGHARWHRSPS